MDIYSPIKTHFRYISTTELNEVAVVFDLWCLFEWHWRREANRPITGQWTPIGVNEQTLSRFMYRDLCVFINQLSFRLRIWSRSCSCSKTDDSRDMVPLGSQLCISSVLHSVFSLNVSMFFLLLEIVLFRFWINQIKMYMSGLLQFIQTKQANNKLIHYSIHLCLAPCKQDIVNQ